MESYTTKNKPTVPISKKQKKDVPNHGFYIQLRLRISTPHQPTPHFNSALGYLRLRTNQLRTDFENEFDLGKKVGKGA
jgi:hypothetical protein